MSTYSEELKALWDSMPEENRKLNAEVFGTPSRTDNGVKQPVRKPASVTVLEKDWQATFIDLCHLAGYKVAHFRPARVMRNGKEIYETPVDADGKGLLDNFCVNPERKDSFWAELKSEKGKLSKEQENWIIRLRACGSRVYVWRPSDYEEVKSVLGVGE